MKRLLRLMLLFLLTLTPILAVSYSAQAALHVDNIQDSAGGESDSHGAESGGGW